jgi:hypothetical protein
MRIVGGGLGYCAAFDAEAFHKCKSDITGCVVTFNNRKLAKVSLGDVYRAARVKLYLGFGVRRNDVSGSKPDYIHGGRFGLDCKVRHSYRLNLNRACDSLIRHGARNTVCGYMLAPDNNGFNVKVFQVIHDDKVRDI